MEVKLGLLIITSDSTDSRRIRTDGRDATDGGSSGARRSDGGAMPFAPVNGVELYYESYGDGPPLVFAHGAGGNHLSWWQQLPVFASRFRCVTFDHRGFGFSRDVPDSPGPRAFGDDLRGLLDHLGIDRANLVSQSMGGWTNAAFAVAHPERVRTLALCDTM